MVAQPVANASSSSSLKDLKTTTTSEVGDEWRFDITPYHKFGFTTSQIKQLASLGVISAADVEQSLIEFSYDLENKTLPPIKTNKINFLMGLLRSGNLYISEAYRNEQDAIILEMARRRVKLKEKISWRRNLRLGQQSLVMKKEKRSKANFQHI